MIAKSPRLTYFHEPFNVDAPPRPWGIDFDQWFKYIPLEDGEDYQEQIEGILHPHIFQFTKQLTVEADSLRDVGRLFRDYGKLLSHHVTGSTPLIKDPIALLSAERLEKTWGSRNVVMIRHPAAFVGSLKVKDWTFPFGDLLHQPRAMSDLFEPYRDEIYHFTQTEKNIVEQAALLWTLLYSVVKKYRDNHPDWIFIRHEDLVRNPNSNFKKVYKKLGLSFTKEIEKEIEKETDPSVLGSWRNRLTEEEISKVRRRTEDVAGAFYADDEW